MKRRWHHGSFKQNRNIRFGDDVIWNTMKQKAFDRAVERDTKEQIREYEENLQELSCYDDDYDYDHYVYHPPDEDPADDFDDDLFDEAYLDSLYALQEYY